MGATESRVGGHITLCFTVDIESENPLMQGSRGFGLSISKGVSVKVTKIDNSQQNRIKFHGYTKETQSNLYYTVLNVLQSEGIPVNEHSWDFDVTLELPPQQGFGLSASGACASAIAIQNAIGVPESEVIPRALKVTHLVERIISGGLGDIAGMSVGGIERRIKSGFPKPLGPGIVESWYEKFPVILVWSGNSGTHTSSYIDSKKWGSKITSAGNNSMQKISRIEWDLSSWELILEESLNFCNNSGLIREENRMKLLKEIDNAIIDTEFKNQVVVRLCMLGESAIILPKKCTDSKNDLMVQISNYLMHTNLDYTVCDVSQSPLLL